MALNWFVPAPAMLSRPRVDVGACQDLDPADAELLDVHEKALICIAFVGESGVGE